MPDRDILSSFPKRRIYNKQKNTSFYVLTSNAVSCQINPIHTLSLISLRSILILSFIFAQVFRMVSSFQAFPAISIRISHLPHACRIPSSSYSSHFDHPKNVLRRVQIMQLCSTLNPSYKSGTNILLRALFSNTLNLCCSLNASDQLSRPCVTVTFWYFGRKRG